MTTLLSSAPVVEAADPRDAWPAWTDQRWTTTGADEAPELPADDESAVGMTDPEFRAWLRRQAEAEGLYAPTPEEDAQWSGFLAGLGDSGSYGPPPSWDRWRRYSFTAGLWAGRLARWEAEDADLELWAARFQLEREADAFEDAADRGPRETDGYAPGYCS